MLNFEACASASLVLPEAAIPRVPAGALLLEAVHQSVKLQLARASRADVPTDGRPLLRSLEPAEQLLASGSAGMKLRILKLEAFDWLASNAPAGGEIHRYQVRQTPSARLLEDAAGQRQPLLLWFEVVHVSLPSFLFVSLLLPLARCLAVPSALLPLAGPNLSVLQPMCSKEAGWPLLPRRSPCRPLPAPRRW